jgi:hypothetical protein
MLLAAAAVVLALPGSAPAAALVTDAPGLAPRSDAAAARLVRRTGEKRPDNTAANHRVPTAAQLRDFRRRSDMPNAARVTGHFTGTTDEILQWAAYKWHVSPDLFRAVATVESWWHMSTVGDGGDSFGLMQMRRPYHCCLPLMQDDTAFNVDYYGAILRAYYAGKQGWLNTTPRGRDYRAGDLWGSIGVWASGRWHLGDERYVADVRSRLAARTWATDPWF